MGALIFLVMVHLTVRRVFFHVNICIHIVCVALYNRPSSVQVALVAE